MPRLKLVFVLVLALLTAGQLAFHHHALGHDTTAGLVCSVCAFGAERATIVAPLSEPLALLCTITIEVAAVVRPGAQHALSARAPPSVA